jgi:hypothetical protein
MSRSWSTNRALRLFNLTGIGMFIILFIIMFMLSRVFCPRGGSEFEAQPTSHPTIAAHKIAIIAYTLLEGLIIRLAKSYWSNPW